MEQKILELKEHFSEVLRLVNNQEDLDEVRVEFLGKKGEITALMQNLRNLPSENRKQAGQVINEFKQYVEGQIEQKLKILHKLEIQNRINSAEQIDITVPSSLKQGSLHPITIVQKEVEEIFKSMGFIVEDGNEVETEFNNFDAVNVPRNHPARDMQDTFWLDNGEVLKTQTSAGQNRILRKYGAPCKVIFPGRCFRNENVDASHENTFFQLEGMMVGKDISIANLIYFMKTMLSKVLKKDVNVRLRPGFFPFVEP
ncbi:MAG: phenylalanine--tRNA ligase subunit alpha, partial [Christensenellales bacterium]